MKGNLTISNSVLLSFWTFLVQELSSGVERENKFHQHLRLISFLKEDFWLKEGKNYAYIYLFPGQVLLPMNELHFSTLISFTTKFLAIFRVIIEKILFNLKYKRQDGQWSQVNKLWLHLQHFSHKKDVQYLPQL